MGKVGLLLALVVGLGGVLEVAGVLDGHGLSGLGLGASALDVMLNGDSHFDWISRWFGVSKMNVYVVAVVVETWRRGT